MTQRWTEWCSSVGVVAFVLKCIGLHAFVELLPRGTLGLRRGTGALVGVDCARIFEVTINAAVTVRDQRENRVLYDNQNFTFRGDFEFASDPRTFFNEEDPAVQRIARG